jgi:Mn2+/Fe2+ NRAMP family transporter
MSQLSVMTTAFLTLVGMDPEAVDATPVQAARDSALEVGTSFALACLVAWLVLSHGYQRMQRVMTVLMVSMFVCFLLIALRSFSEIGDILRGFVPAIPDDLSVPDRDTARLSTGSIIAIVGSTLAPGSLLAIPYLSSDAARVRGRLTLREDLHKFMVNLGLIFGAYSIFILIAGGFALYPLANHAGIETVHDAGQVLTKALPRSLNFVGPVIFTLGLFVAAMTTLVICVQIVIYLSLDMLNKPWKFSGENRLYNRLGILVTVAIGVLAPVWNFPAMLKVILMMGVNVFVVPLVIGAMIYLLNRRAVMGPHTAGASRNTLLALCLLVACGLAATQLPDYLAMFF